MALSCELEWDKPEVILTIDQIIERTGLERKTVMNCLKELEKNLIDARTKLGLYYAQLFKPVDAKAAVERIVDLALNRNYKKSRAAK